jgi:hypothetical protein
MQNRKSGGSGFCAVGDHWYGRAGAGPPLRWRGGHPVRHRRSSAYSSTVAPLAAMTFLPSSIAVWLPFTHAGWPSSSRPELLTGSDSVEQPLQGHFAGVEVREGEAGNTPSRSGTDIGNASSSPPALQPVLVERSPNPIRSSAVQASAIKRDAAPSPSLASERAVPIRQRRWMCMTAVPEASRSRAVGGGGGGGCPYDPVLSAAAADSPRARAACGSGAGCRGSENRR